MTGVLFALGPCIVCGELHSFNPDNVPSIEGRPICRRCITEINEVRVDQGLEPVVIYPDSYEGVSS